MEWIVYKSKQKKNPESEIAFQKLSEKNKARVLAWLSKKRINSKSEKREGNRRRAIIKVLTFVKKDWDKINYEDYFNVASAISRARDIGIKQKNGDREHISRFLKDSFEDWERKFKGQDDNKALEYLKCEKDTEENKLTARDLLTDLEIERMMRANSDMKKICIIVVLIESACRPEELLKLKWADVDFRKNLLYLYSSKTKRRRNVPIKNAMGHLTRLKEETDGKDDDLIFKNPSGNMMTIAGLNQMLHDLSEKAKIKKRVYAYLFRHTRLSFLITKLSPKVYEEIAGHSLEMGMKTYAHLSQEAIIKEMNEKIFEIKELTEDKREELEKQIAELKNQLSEQKKFTAETIKDEISPLKQFIEQKSKEMMSPEFMLRAFQKIYGKNTEYMQKISPKMIKALEKH